MCSLNKLYQDKFGYAVKCGDCVHVQIAFGTSVLTLTGIEFRAFSALLDDELQETQFIENSDVKRIYVPTFTKNVGIILSVTEARRLQHIVVNATLQLDAEDLLSE